jgi:hypothetical protein
MNLNIDFVLLIAVLVLLQLFVLSVDVNKDDKSNDVIENETNGKNNRFDAFGEEMTNNHKAEKKELSLVVHRSNGEEKIYKKSDVA